MIQKISHNIIKSIRYHIIKDDENLEKNEKLLLWDNLIFKNCKYSKKSKSLGSYYYPCILENYINNSMLYFGYM